MEPRESTVHSAWILARRPAMPRLLSVSLLLALPVAAYATPPSEPRVQFNRDIRPILSDTCYTCHGPAKSTRKANLRFDTHEGAFVDLGGYKAIVPGDLEKSELWKRISAADPAE